MALFSIDSFRTALNAPARGYFFQCKIEGLNYKRVSDFLSTPDAALLCKAVTLPSATIDTTELFYFSRAVKIPSRRTYAPLTLTFFHTEDYKIRAGFEQWSNALNHYQNNQRGDGPAPLPSLTDLYGTITLHHHSSKIKITTVNGQRTEDVQEIAKYTLYNAFPTTVSGLQFSYDADGEFQTFDVEFQYQYFSTDLTTRTLPSA